MKLLKVYKYCTRNRTLHLYSAPAAFKNFNYHERTATSLRKLTLFTIELLVRTSSCVLRADS